MRWEVGSDSVCLVVTGVRGARTAEVAWGQRLADVSELSTSGASVDQPALQCLLKRADERQIDCVAIHRLDRLTRSLWDWVTLLGGLSRRDVTLAVVAGDLAGLATGADRGLLFNLLAILAELERDLINDRLRDARRARQARGFRVCRIVLDDAGVLQHYAKLGEDDG